MKSKADRFLTKRLDSGSAGDREEFSEFTVVGTYADIEKDFVTHAAMLRGSVELPAEAEIEVWHMGRALQSRYSSRGSAIYFGCIRNCSSA